MIARRIGPLLVLGAMMACAGKGSGGNVAKRSIDEVLAAHTDSLMALPGVVGTAVGLCQKERCIRVLVAGSNAETLSKIPPQLEGYRVVVDVAGMLRPRDSS